MTSELTFLLKSGWNNLWKNRIIWLFSSLILIEPLLRIIVPIQRPISFLSLGISLASLYFMTLSIAGISFVMYSVAIENSVHFKTTFRVAQKLFWRIIVLLYLLILIIAPLAFIVTSVLWNFLHIRDLYHNFFFASIPLSVFAAMWSFPITETIANNSNIGKSLKSSWIVFTHNFSNLSITGLLLLVVLRVTILSISVIMFLFQNNFDVSLISKFDFISPALSFPQNALYKFIVAIPQAVWQAYSISIFTVAYLKYRDAEMSKDIIA